MRIHTEQLSFCYVGGRPTVQDISLDIPTGTLTILCGVNGSGKSTLLRLLAGLAQPSSGQILYNHGKKPDYKNPEAVSMVFQQPETQLFAGTVHKDIEYGLIERRVSKEKRTEIIASALAKTGLAYDEFAGRSPFLLSGGEKRRVCIAGALAVQPGLLILDEPTAGLDPQAEQALLEMVQELRSSGLTLIIGTHDLDSFLPVADKVIVMKQGAIHYDGPAPALTADPGLLADAGLTLPVYASMGRRAVQHGLLEAVPDSLEELLTALEKHPLPIPQMDKRQAGDVAAAGRGAIWPGSPNGSASEHGTQHGNASEHSAQYSTVEIRHREHSPQATGAETAQAIIKPGNPRQEPTPPRRPGWQAVDPRAKWLGMILGSLVLLGMHTLLPLLLTAGLLAGLAASARISWRRAFRFFRPFLLMFLFLWLLSGLSWSAPDFALGPLSFSYAGLMRGESACCASCF